MREGWIVFEAADGEEVLKMVEEENLDLILMDIGMPRINGIEAVRILRKKGYTMPVYALTAHTNPDDESECMTAGMNGFMRKPINEISLIKIIKENFPSGHNIPQDNIETGNQDK